MIKCNIKRRAWGYVSMDCYGYEAECECGETMTGWSEQECEEEAQNHLKKSICPICGKVMEYSHKNIHGERIYYCEKDGKIEVPN